MKYSELLRLLKSKGARFVAHGKEHDVWKRNGNTTRVPRHNKEIGKSLLESMLKDLQIK